MYTALVRIDFYCWQYMLNAFVTITYLYILDWSQKHSHISLHQSYSLKICPLSLHSLSSLHESVTNISLPIDPDDWQLSWFISGPMKGFDQWPTSPWTEQNGWKCKFLFLSCIYANDQWLKPSDDDTWLIWFSHVFCEWNSGELRLLFFIYSIMHLKPM